MAKAKQGRSESAVDDLLERIQQLEARLATVEAGLEAEAALFAVSPPRARTASQGQRVGLSGPQVAPTGTTTDTAGAAGTAAATGVAGTASVEQVGTESSLNGFAHGRDGGAGAAGPTLTAAPPAPRSVGGSSGQDGEPGVRRFADSVAAAFADDDADEAEGVDPEAVSDAAARRKQPDSPIPFTPGDLRSRLGKPGGVMFTGAARLPRGVRAAWQSELAMVDLLDADWGAEAEQVAALAHPVRLALLREVLKGARSVSALASLPGLGTSGQLYHHLKPLLAEGWLQPAGRGRYEVPNDRVLPLLGIIAAVRRP